MKKISIAIFLFVLAFCGEQPYKLVIHNTDTNAKCLDGTSPGLYLHEGGDTKHFLVFFVGGGFCAGATTEAVLEDCYQRSKTDLGTSKNLQPQIISPGGYISTDS